MSISMRCQRLEVDFQEMTVQKKFMKSKKQIGGINHEKNIVHICICDVCTQRCERRKHDNP